MKISETFIAVNLELSIAHSRSRARPAAAVSLVE
jgi:hypothetical protein